MGREMEMGRWAESEAAREGVRAMATVNRQWSLMALAHQPSSSAGLVLSRLWRPPPSPSAGADTLSARAGARAVAPCRRPSPSGCCIPLLNAAGHNARLASFVAILPAQSLPLPLLVRSRHRWPADVRGPRHNPTKTPRSRANQNIALPWSSRAHSPPILLCWANAQRAS